MTIEDRIRSAAHRFADELASALREELRADDVVDQYTSPLGRRRHLEAARRGAFPVTRQGRLVLARRSDVDAYRHSPRPGRRPALASAPASQPMPVGSDSVDDMLSELGITPRKTG